VYREVTNSNVSAGVLLRMEVVDLV